MRWPIVLGVFALAVPALLWVVGAERQPMARAPLPRRAVRSALSSEPPPPDVNSLVSARGRGRGVFYIPDDCFKKDGRYDAVLHFHGVPQVLSDALEQSNLHAALGVWNAGTVAEDYSRGFSIKGILVNLLEDLHQTVQSSCDNRPERRRVALSGFSAGYGAVHAVLKGDSELVDAVLLEDGLHTAFDDVKRRHIPANQLAAFVEFAQKARRGDKLFSITHTAIMTDGYASTTESTNFLLQKLGLTRHWDPATGITEVNAGGFRLRGEPGTDASAHAAQLRSIGRVHFPLLRERWVR